MQQPPRDSTYSNLSDFDLVPLARRWGVSGATILQWRETGDKQFALLAIGMKARDKQRSAAASPGHSHMPVKNLSLFVQQHGVYIKDVVRLSGLTRQTLGRLAGKRRSACRLRDLIAGTEATLAAATESMAG